jgi:hypothetical protein
VKKDSPKQKKALEDDFCDICNLRIMYAPHPVCKGVSVVSGRNSERFTGQVFHADADKGVWMFIAEEVFIWLTDNEIGQSGCRPGLAATIGAKVFYYLQPHMKPKN